jgi:hypothetical protein
VINSVKSMILIMLYIKPQQDRPRRQPLSE